MADDDLYTEDPDLWESERLRGGTPIDFEEAGRQQGKPTEAVLHPCPHCGIAVVYGQTAQGALVPLEPTAQVYTLVWHQGAAWPRLAQSRGYVAHACGG